MNQKLILLSANLHIFEGGAASGTGSASGEGGAAPATGESKASSAAGKKSGELQNVVYGKQSQMVTNAAERTNGDAGRNDNGDYTVTSSTQEERRKAYQDLINGEYKDLYTQDTQNMINRRFKETKNLESQLQTYGPIIDSLMQRYKITDGDVGKLQQAIDNDDAWLEEAADEAGMTVDQFKAFQKLEKENKQLLQAQQSQQLQQKVETQVQQWVQEADAVKQKFPTFDLNTEIQNPEFVKMLKNGVPVEHAFKIIHYDDILTEAMQTTAKTQEKLLTDNVRARGMRPTENGVSGSRSSFTVKDDVSKLTRKDRAEIARRAARGEIISF